MIKQLMKQCECGKIVTGTSMSQLTNNFKVHKKSVDHKRDMELKNKLRREEEVKFDFGARD